MPALLSSPPASSPRGHTRRDCSFAQPHYSERNNPVLLSRRRELARALSLSPGLSQENRTSCQLFGRGGGSNSTRQGDVVAARIRPYSLWNYFGHYPRPGNYFTQPRSLRGQGASPAPCSRRGGRSHDHWDIVSQSVHSPLRPSKLC